METEAREAYRARCREGLAAHLDTVARVRAALPEAPEVELLLQLLGEVATATGCGIRPTDDVAGGVLDAYRAVVAGPTS